MSASVDCTQIGLFNEVSQQCLVKADWKVGKIKRRQRIFSQLKPLWLETSLCLSFSFLVQPLVPLPACFSRRGRERLLGVLCIRAGQFWVIILDFFLQLNLCVCYRENHFRPITDLCRTLLTPARSHIWRVNKLTRENSSLKFSTLPRVHNEHVPRFQDPMLSK